MKRLLILIALLALARPAYGQSAPAHVTRNNVVAKNELKFTTWDVETNRTAAAAIANTTIINDWLESGMTSGPLKTLGGQLPGCGIGVTGLVSDRMGAELVGVGGGNQGGRAETQYTTLSAEGGPMTRLIGVDPTNVAHGLLALHPTHTEVGHVYYKPILSLRAGEGIFTVTIQGKWDTFLNVNIYDGTLIGDPDLEFTDNAAYQLAHAADFRSATGVEILSTQSGVNTGRHYFRQTVSNCRTAYRFEDFSATADNVNNGADTCTFINPRTPGCDTGYLIDNTQAISNRWIGTYYLGGVGTGILQKKGGSLETDEIRVANNTECAVHMTGTNANSFGQKMFSAITFDGANASHTSRALWIESPDEAAYEYSHVEIGFLGINPQRDLLHPAIKLKRSYGDLVIRSGELLYDGMIWSQWGTAGFHRKIYIYNSIFAGDDTPETIIANAGSYISDGYVTVIWAGCSNALGPIVDGGYTWNNGTKTRVATNAQSPPALPYGSAWNGNLTPASKDDIFDANFGSGTGGTGAPTDATYVTNTPNGSLGNEQALSTLSTGIMQVTTGTGAVTSITDSTGLATAISGETGSGLLVFGTSPTLTTPLITGGLNQSGGTITTAGGLWNAAQTWNDPSNSEIFDGLSITITDSGSSSASRLLRLRVGATTMFAVSRTGLLTFVDGVRQIFNPNGTNAGLNVGSQAGDPSAPVNGDLWYDSTGGLLRAYINGSSVSLGAGGGGGLTAADLDTAAELQTILGAGDFNGTGAFLCSGATSAVFVTPLLGTPTSGTLTNCTGLPIVAGTTGALSDSRIDNNLTISGGSVDASAIGASVPSTGAFTTLTASTAITVPNGGTGAVTHTAGNILIGAGTAAISSFAPGTGVQAFLTTPSGANLATALTTALPATKGGTGLTALGTGVATALGVATDADGGVVTIHRTSAASTSTLTPVGTATIERATLTAQAAALTIAAPSGTPLDGNSLIVRITDNGTARGLTWNAAYRDAGATMPTTTVLGKVHTVGFLYNTSAAKWDCVAASVQP